MLKGSERTQQEVIGPDSQKQLSNITLWKYGIKDTRERCKDCTGF